MKEILNLIENVDPNDTDTLDEIDARVWCLVEGHEYLSLKSRRAIQYHHKDGYETATAPGVTPHYCTSRDALKSIRPVGWHWKANRLYSAERFLREKGWSEGFAFVLSKYKKNKDGRIEVVFQTEQNPAFPTEELAELHAIIQAIESERE